MRFLRKFRPSPALVVASIGLLVALGGTSIAAISNVPLLSVGTPQLKGNAVVSSKVKNRSLLAVDFKQGQLPRGPRGAAGAPGPAGAAGPAGPSGPAGAAATALWASVDQNGTLVRNRGAASAQRNAVGTYQVVFNQDVTGCIYQATPGGPTTGLSSAHITVSQLPAVSAGVRVATFNPTVTAAQDSSFFLAVFC